MPANAVDIALARRTAPAAPRDVRGSSGGLTIAIPNWNHELLLPRSVGSALAAVAELRKQGVAAEVLVIDDHSRDGSRTLLQQLEALHYEDGLRVTALTRNQGLPAVRNLALRTARHQFVAFMDADNEILPANVPSFYRSMIATQAAVVYGNLLVRGPDGFAERILNNESFQQRMFDASYIDAFAIVDRFQIADAGGYTTDAGFYACEDWELYLHLACAGRRVVFVPLVFGFYYDMANSMVKAVRSDDVEFYHRRQRTFNQLGTRNLVEPNTEHLRYHPDLGYF